MTTLLTLVIISISTPSAGNSVDYIRDIKPVLAKRCYACHAALKQKAGLRLDTAASILQGGESGSAVEPGQADESLLVDRVTNPDPSYRMPPEGEPLTTEEIDHLRAWINAGAPIPSEESPQKDPRQHWAYIPPVRPQLPKVSNSAWVRNPIDTFLAAEHEVRGLVPRPSVNKATLLRRVSLDLTGLAPTPDQLHAFLNDPTPDAYEAAVERLLASPQYGERWGRHWMDVWRYSDWYGYGAEVRHSQPHIWRWRDWIVESLNQDKGYDQMVVEMLAGDEVAPDDPKTLRATGYLVRNWFKFNRHVWLQDTVDHTAKAFLGITFNCARCHDHKYDPIAQEDYYRFRAFFEPHDVRTDRVPGQPDTGKDGLVRVYDAHAETPTYLFVRGDDMQPVKDKPLSPGLPRILGGELTIASESLPPRSYYTALQPHIQAEAIASAESDIQKATLDLDAARKAGDAALERLTSLESELSANASALAEARSAIAKAKADALLAETALRAARLELASRKARITADEARFAQPPDSKKAEILALMAGHAERQAALAKAEETLARAEHALADARQALALKPGDAKAEQAVSTAEARLADARKGIEPARKALDSRSGKYTPISPIYPATTTGRRLALAKWITHRDNPTAARVAVNHIWMRHFGEPLVPTVFDFGLNGKPPTHPELLDWLAVEFIEHGWSLKHLHRLIVTSNAYRMESTAGPDNSNNSVDPSNVYLWRMNPKRMEAEIIRDNLLAIAGNLDPAMGGPELDENSALTTYRRSLYYRHAPEKQAVFLKLFDTANTTACYRRDVSVIPQQALALANSPLALAQARRLASRLSKDPVDTADGAFVAAAFEHILGRAPNLEEQSVCEDYLASQAARLADPGTLTPFHEGPACPVAPSPDPRQRARENLVHVLINHNDFVTIR